MKFFQKPSKVSKIFLLGVLPAVLLAGGILYFSSKKFLTDTSCGCGLPTADVTGEYEETNKTAIFNNQPVDYKLAKLTPSSEALKEQEGAVLGATDDSRWIEIDLSNQKLYAHEGDKIAYEFSVSSGKSGHPLQLVNLEFG